MSYIRLTNHSGAAVAKNTSLLSCQPGSRGVGDIIISAISRVCSKSGGAAFFQEHLDAAAVVADRWVGGRVVGVEQAVSGVDGGVHGGLLNEKSRPCAGRPAFEAPALTASA